MPLQTFTITNPDELDNLGWFRSLRTSTLADTDAAAQTAAIVAAVRTERDAALVRYMAKWSDPAFTAARIPVSPDALTAALAALDPALRSTLEQAIQNVRAYQQHILPRDPAPTTIAGAQLGLRFTPIDRVGLLVPGGRAAYPSTVIMLAVPALVAGVSAANITVVSPPPTQQPIDSANTTDADISPLVLATCALLGITRVNRIGGAQAVAALAFGTESVAPVDLIAGPGNLYTQLAKQHVAGVVGIDGFYGPSEILTIADDSANPAHIASDLIAQAEHDPGRCILVAWSQKTIDAINNAIAQQLPARTRRTAIESALANDSAAVLVPDQTTAAAIANRIAAEHVNLAVADPTAWLDRVRNGGEFFLGDQTPVAAGDYYAGPSHCLPTATTARFASGVSVYTFLKRSATVHYPESPPPDALSAIARLAQAEGLEAHAASAQSRLNR